MKCHAREKDDLALGKKGWEKNLREKSGILKGVSACYKTKKAAWMLTFFAGVVRILRASVTFLE